MYETEVNHGAEPSSLLPLEVISAFGKLAGRITARTVLPWSEHCTECVWPTCYTTCDLYVAREDGRCRRFADGMVRIDCPTAFNSYLLKIKFKRWAKLWSPGNVRLHSIEKAGELESSDYRIGSMLQHFPLPAKAKQVITSKRYSYKKRRASRAPNNDTLPTSFLLECYNPEKRLVRLSLTMRSADEQIKIPFQQLIELTPGFHRISVPMKKIANVIDVHKSFYVELIPDDVEGEITTLYFGLVEFVREVSTTRDDQTVKCIVWDLDNTVWNGILTEDGVTKLQLKSDIGEIVRTLDERGILHSIASKNNSDEAIQALEHFGLREYFLYPQISWQPKSESIKQIARQLNIGIDRLLFIDDSEFELAEVKSTCPEVRVLNARHYRELPNMGECQVPVSAESKGRRKMYQMESKRQDMAESFGSDYTAFLRHCEITVSIRRMTAENIERVHELTQRTNQMNFSGNRYDRDVLKDILAAPFLDTYVLSCEDRFGSYGVIGFSIVDNREPRMTDLMFSCRIQSKRVEHAFMAYLIGKYIEESSSNFLANYRKTPKNAPSGRVFADLGMEEIAVKDGVTSLVFRKGRSIPDDGVIRIVTYPEAVLQA
jgi:FkbH-like protein